MGRSFRPFPFVLGIITMIVVGSLRPADAVPITASEPANMFGNLAQGATKCPGTNCGPTSAINSFVFLQNMYPKIYGNMLIGNAADPGTKKELVAAANNLACNFTLNCGANRALGTPIGDFILGKRAYINTVSGGALKGSTSFAAQISEPWRKVHQFHGKATKPGFVDAGTKPTWRFLYDQVKAGEDVEIVVRGPLTFHYLTLTSITFDPATKKGSLSVIDPGTGKPTPRAITLAKLANGFLLTNYQRGNAVILDAVAESPRSKGVAAPEPASLALLLVGCVGLFVARRRSR